MDETINKREPLSNISVDTLKSAFEASRSPLILTDYSLPDNPIVYSNQAFIDLCGYDMDQVIGSNCRFLQGDDTDKTQIAALRKAVKTGTYVRVTIKNYKKDGTPFWNDLVLSPIKDATGKTTHFIGMQLDITDRVEAEAKMLAKTDELEMLNHELEQFTYATSHDLQEPLRMVHSYLQLLNKRYGSQLDADAQTFLGFATEGAERMQDLINDLLTLSRVTDNTRRLKETSLMDVTSRAIANLKQSVEESQARITVDKLPTMQVDSVQMTQLMQNLISNAIKYSLPEVTPEINVTAEVTDHQVVVSVADNGIGIPGQHKDRVFVLFQRLHTRSEYPGTGIGLAICSKIIDRHNGKIWVESEEGKGSIFKFSLPTQRKEQL